MICPRCNRLVPSGSLACPGCVWEVAKAELRRFQHYPLLEISRGRGRFTTRVSSGRIRHLQMFGCSYAFCGEQISGIGTRGGQMPISAIDEPYICAGCRDAVREILAEAQRVSR
jgi:hypothetical protein